MKYRLIEAEKAEHRISRLCKVLGVTRPGLLRVAPARAESAATGPRRRHSSLGGVSPNEYERRCLNRQEKNRLIQ
jgi:hypothetical protein